LSGDIFKKQFASHFIYLRAFTQISIINGKFRRCNNTFTNALFILLLTKNI